MNENWHISLAPERCTYSPGPRPALVEHDWFATTLDDFDLWVCTSGQGTLELPDGAPIPLRRGSVVLFRPGMRCQCRQDPKDATLCMYYFHFDIFQYRGGPRIDLHELESIPVVMEPADTAFIEMICQRLLMVLRRIGRRDNSAEDIQISQQFATSLLRTLLLDLEVSSRVHHELRSHGFELAHYKRVMDLVGALQENPILYKSVHEMAQACNWSANHFTRIFRSITRTTPIRFLLELRIRRAKELLLNTELGTAEVAAALGYESPYFFYRQFKRYSGMTPTEFRASSVRDLPKRNRSL